MQTPKFATLTSCYLIQALEFLSLVNWTTGAFGYRSKLSALQIQQLSNKLEECNQFKPKELHRFIRPISYLKNWKGTEYRNFLMYFGPIVLKDMLPTQVYDHFLILFCAVRIVSSDHYRQYLNVADVLFKNYIRGFIELYG